MENQNYNRVIKSTLTAQEAFDGINNIPLWWTEDFEGTTQKQGDIFTVRFGDIFKTFIVTESIPEKKMVWQVTDCYMPWLTDKHEWTGTSIIWEISTVNDTTQVIMNHIGLVPTVECYTDCEKGWNYFLDESLAKLLTGEQAKPEPVRIKTM